MPASIMPRALAGTGRKSMIRPPAIRPAVLYRHLHRSIGIAAGCLDPRTKRQRAMCRCQISGIIHWSATGIGRIRIPTRNAFLRPTRIRPRIGMRLWRCRRRNCERNKLSPICLVGNIDIHIKTGKMAVTMLLPECLQARDERNQRIRQSRSNR